MDILKFDKEFCNRLKGYIKERKGVTRTADWFCLKGHRLLSLDPIENRFCVNLLKKFDGKKRDFFFFLGIMKT